LGATAITVQFTISPSTGTGGNYSETQALTTDAFGVFHAVIGKGSKVAGSDDFKTLDYTRTGTIYKLKVEVKKTSGGIYTTINEADFNAVPYARKAENGVPVGTIIAYAGLKTKIPEGWAICDGSQKDGSSTDWKQLYDAIGTAWGGSGTTFYLPDLRGMFLRGVNDSRSDAYKDPDASSRSSFRTGANSGDAVGAVQADNYRSHNHGVTDPGHNHAYGDIFYAEAGGAIAVTNNLGSGDSDNDNGGSEINRTTGNRATGISINNNGGNETRPQNAGVYYIIKY